MKILFACGDLEKNLHASNKIIFQLAQSLVQKGHSCTLAGICTYHDAFNKTVDGVDFVHMNSSHICDRAYLEMEKYVRSCNGDRAAARKDFYLAHPVYSAALMYRYSISKKPLFSEKSYSKQLNSLIEATNPDIIVVNYMPFIHAYGFIKDYKGDIPVIAYQLDPWGLHCALTSQEEKDKNIAEETALFDRCAAIITTPVLLKQYSQHKVYRKYLNKMTALNFPNVKPMAEYKKEDCVFDYDSNTVNLLFCGIVHDDYRSPSCLLNSLKAVREKGLTSFKVHFLGQNESPYLTQFMEQNSWVTHHNSVPLEKAFATMAQSDVLINIGNTYNNQVPSKIFDYLSFGKAILNVEKIALCPAREFFDRYPLSFTLQEHSAVDRTIALSAFISSAKGSSLPYIKVEQLFSDCTLAYASDVFYDIIKRL